MWHYLCIIKKFLISVSVFGIFIAYSLSIRHEVPTVGKPASLAANASPAVAPAQGAFVAHTITSGKYNDGTYVGSVADAYYGNVQVSATISGGKIADVQFVDHPHTHQTSVAINNKAMGYLTQEAIQAQSANVQIVSGATFTSQAFMESLGSALARAKA